MSKIIKGVFLPDLHKPFNIDLEGVFAFVKDFSPNLVVLGGDCIDAEEVFKADTMTAGEFKMAWYDRDVALFKQLVLDINACVPKAAIEILEGNHEFRYTKLSNKFGTTLGKRLDLLKDMNLPSKVLSKIRWIPYNNYNSFTMVGDLTMIHGSAYPDAHAKKYATMFTPKKVLYGHLHDFQGYTLLNASPFVPARYAVTCGCLCKLNPEWKKGQAHKWVNGFAYFYSINGVTTVNPVIIDKGDFMVGTKLYKGGK